MHKYRVAYQASIQLNVCLLTALYSLSAFATPNLKQKQLNTLKGYQKHMEIMRSFEKLQRPVEFSDLPNFDKATFIGGYLQPSQNGSSSCQMKFLSTENPQAVLDFYKTVLPNYHWHILHAGQYSVTARHTDGHICTINVNESKLPKTKSKFIVAYRRIEKQR